MTDAEVIIVGGGPAGSTCAWKLREAGRDVIILDKQDFPRPKPCAGWITPRVLRDLRIDPQTYPLTLTRFDRLRFHIRKRSFSLRTLQYAIRRVEFDEWLLRRANVPVHHVAVGEIRNENAQYVIDEAYRCRYLVGAGGTHCPVYRTFFKEFRPRSGAQQIAAMEAEYPTDVGEEDCHLWFPKDLPGYSWYVPKGKRYVNIGVGGKSEIMQQGAKTVRDYWNKLIDSLGRLTYLNTPPTEPRGHLYYLRHGDGPVQRDNVYIVGDAASLATVDMGEGIGPAVRSGILAAEAIVQGTTYSVASVSRLSFFDLVFPHRR